jgi:predicted DNA-binding transcriptional regulator AlpA
MSRDGIFLNSRQVRDRYGQVSDMWVWRRLDEDEGFPKPIRIKGRRFWRRADLEAWEATQSEAD